MSGLQNNRGRLNAMLDQLCSKLHPVRRNEPPRAEKATCDPKGSPSESSLVGAISNESYQLHLMCEQIDRVIGELEI